MSFTQLRRKGYDKWLARLAANWNANDKRTSWTFSLSCYLTEQKGTRHHAVNLSTPYLSSKFSSAFFWNFSFLTTMCLY
jgi:hypothetical protein